MDKKNKFETNATERSLLSIHDGMSACSAACNNEGRHQGLLNESEGTSVIQYRFVGIMLAFLLLCGCSATYIDGGSNVPSDHSGGTRQDHSLLPSGFTLQNIQSAFEQYINDRLWFYPAVVWGGPTDKDFDSYIGQTLDVDVRVYEDESGVRQVYAQTSAGEWLVHFMSKQGIVYAEGQVSQNEEHYPQSRYETVGTFTIEVREPHSPKYGISPRKEKLITAMEEMVEAVCRDLEESTESDTWSGTEVYITNFYEYEDTGAAWLVRTDGYAWYMPMEFVEEDRKSKAVPGKGYGLEDVYVLDKDDPGRFTFERQSQIALKKTTCDFGTTMDI